jgi:Ca2+-binding EF-hand superfamily protein
VILKHYAFAVAVCLGLSAGVLAQGPGGRPQTRLVLNALDTDHDGKLSAAEIAAAPQSLLKLDTNGDGMLTFDELTPRPENAGASSAELVKQWMSFDKTGKGYLVPADLPERMQGIFRRADADHDGKLTPAEIASMSARQGMPNGLAPGKGRAGGLFRMDPLLNALDLDHDGVISAAEIAAASKSLLVLDKNGDGEITPDEMKIRQQTPEERADHMLEEWDTNKDGRISKAEAPERMAGAAFDAADKNHDGFLDRDELVEMFRVQASQPRREGPPQGEQKPQ